jgi:hypothetical protein
MSLTRKFLGLVAVTASSVLGAQPQSKQLVVPVEFQISPANGKFVPMLVETHSGCMWAIIPDRSEFEQQPKGGSGPRASISEEMDLLHLLGYYRLVPIKSVKSEWCQKTFGMTSPANEKLPR